MPDETKPPRSRARKSPLPAVPTGPGMPVATKPSPTSTSQPLRVAWTSGAPTKTAVRQIPTFDPAQYFATDLTTASSSLPVTSEADHQQYMQTIDGQNRTVDIMIGNLRLRKRVLDAEGIAIDAEIAATNNAAKAQDLVTAQIKHEQAYVKSGIAYAQLDATKHDLNGFTAEAGLKAQTWEVKLTNLELGLVEANHLLTQRHAAVQALVGGNGTVPTLPTIDLSRGRQAA